MEAIWARTKTTGPSGPSKPGNGLLFQKTNSEEFRGKPRTTLPTKADEDLVILKNKTEQLRGHGYNKIFRSS